MYEKKRKSTIFKVVNEVGTTGVTLTRLDVTVDGLIEWSLLAVFVRAFHFCTISISVTDTARTSNKWTFKTWFFVFLLSLIWLEIRNNFTNPQLVPKITMNDCTVCWFDFLLVFWELSLLSNLCVTYPASYTLVLSSWFVTDFLIVSTVTVVSSKSSSIEFEFWSSIKHFG